MKLFKLFLFISIFSTTFSADLNLKSQINYKLNDETIYDRHEFYQDLEEIHDYLFRKLEIKKLDPIKKIYRYSDKFIIEIENDVQYTVSKNFFDFEKEELLIGKTLGFSYKKEDDEFVWSDKWFYLSHFSHDKKYLVLFSRDEQFFYVRIFKQE